jgi:hypothetical protein
MSATIRLPVAALLVVVLCQAAHGQNPPEIPAGAPPYAAPPAAAPAGAGPEAAPPPGTGAAPMLDDWMLYRRPHDCFCPIGGDGPIKTELYLRSGVDFKPFGPGVYGHILETGWEIQGGARVLFCTPDTHSAWVVDLGVVNMLNDSSRPDVQIPLTVLVPSPSGGEVLKSFGANGVPGVTASSLNRTFGSIGLGKEWWHGGPAEAPGWKWRWGPDVGFRYGSEDATFNEIRHRTDTIHALYAAFHFDVEHACGCCTYFLGLRAEYSYTWSDILQSQNYSDVQDATLMFNIGVRF